MAPDAATPPAPPAPSPGQPPSPAPPPAPAPPSPGQPPTGGNGNPPETVPYSRLQESVAAVADLRKQLEKYQADQKAREEAELSEAQKAAKRAAELEQRAVDAEARAGRLERERLIERAAIATRFVDPSDAAALIAAGVEVTDEASALKAVKALAEAKPHLVGDPGARPRAMGAPESGAPPTPSHADSDEDAQLSADDRAVRDAKRGIGEGLAAMLRGPQRP